MDTNSFRHVAHGLMMGVISLILGIVWAGYMATHHETLHGSFERQEAGLQHHASSSRVYPGSSGGVLIPTALAHEQHGEARNAGHQHSHSGSLAMDAMQRLLRGHIHWMGLGILSIAMLFIVASTSLKPCWKRLLGWSFGLGALVYPLAWIIMGFRTVAMGPDAAESSVMWIFVPAAALILGSLVAVLGILFLETMGWHKTRLVARFFRQASA